MAFQKVGDFPGEVVADGLSEVFQGRAGVDGGALVPVGAVFGVDGAFVVFFFGEDGKFPAAEADEIDDFLVAFFGAVGVAEVAAGFFAVRPRIAVVSKIDEFHHIVFLVRLADAEDVDIGLDAGFAYEEVDGHFDAGKKGAVFQNFPIVGRGFSASGGVLDDDGGVAFIHHGEGFLDENHAVSGGGVRGIQDEGVGGKFLVGLAEAVVSVKFGQGVFVQNVGATVAHEDHIQDGEHIDFGEDLEAEELIRFDVGGFLRVFFGGFDFVFGVVEHFIHGGDEETGGSCGEV